MDPFITPLIILGCGLFLAVCRGIAFLVEDELNRGQGHKPRVLTHDEFLAHREEHPNDSVLFRPDDSRVAYFPGLYDPKPSRAAANPRVYSAKDADEDGWINVGTVGPGESIIIDLSDTPPKD